MEAKDKAKELVDKYMVYSYTSSDKDGALNPVEEKENAKQCALICVEEIRSSVVWYKEDMLTNFGDYLKQTDNELYWLKVKEEIEKL